MIDKYLEHANEELDTLLRKYSSAPKNFKMSSVMPAIFKYLPEALPRNPISMELVLTVDLRVSPAGLYWTFERWGTWTDDVLKFADIMALEPRCEPPPPMLFPPPPVSLRVRLGFRRLRSRFMLKSIGYGHHQVLK